MVTFQKYVYMSKNNSGESVNYVEGACLSTDTKPTDNIANGSKLMEMNTGKFFMFDASSSQWIEWGADPA